MTKKIAPTLQAFTPACEFSFSKLYDHSASTLDDMSLSTMNSVTGPLTLLEGPLLSPLDISYLANNDTGASRAKRSYENDAYSQLAYKYCQLEHELNVERQAHNSLKYVQYLFSSYSTT